MPMLTGDEYGKAGSCPPQTARVAMVKRGLTVRLPMPAVGLLLVIGLAGTCAIRCPASLGQSLGRRASSEVGAVRWSPDGQYLAAVRMEPWPDVDLLLRSRSDTDPHVATVPSGIWLFDRRGNPVRRLTAQAGRFGWAGHHLILVADQTMEKQNGAGEWLLYDLRGNQVSEIRPSHPLFGNTTWAASPDGKYLLYEEMVEDEGGHSSQHWMVLRGLPSGRPIAKWRINLTWMFAWSPSSREAYGYAPPGLWRLQVAGPELEQVVSGDLLYDGTGPLAADRHGHLLCSWGNGDNGGLLLTDWEERQRRIVAKAPRFGYYDPAFDSVTGTLACEGGEFAKEENAIFLGTFRDGALVLRKLEGTSDVDGIASPILAWRAGHSELAYCAEAGTIKVREFRRDTRY